MAVKFIAVKCPECGANLQIEEGREHMFCSYCGAKIMMTNDNEYIYRHIDEAEVKQAETERMVELKKLEMEEKERASRNDAKKVKIKISLVLVAIMLVTIALGYSINAEGLLAVGMICGLIVAWMWLIDIAKANQERDEKDDGRVRVPNGIIDCEKKNYNVVKTMLEGAGFTNIKCIPLHDLTAGLLKKPDTVESVTINGDSILIPGVKYQPAAPVVISYHSYK